MLARSIFLIVLNLLVQGLGQGESLRNNFGLENTTTSVEMVRFTFQLIENCISKFHNTVAIIGDVNDVLVSDIHESQTIALSSIGTLRSIADRNYSIAVQTRSMWLSLYHVNGYFQLKHTVHGFVITVQTVAQLEHLLTLLRTSPWWCNLGSLIIMESTDGNWSCKDAYPFLWKVWKYGVLSSVFLCNDGDGKLAMYAYNPYSDLAPRQWMKAGEYRGRYGHPWSLFKRTDLDDRVDCKSIFFEKTSVLNGYPVRVNGITVHPLLYVNNSKSGLDKYSGEEGEIMRSWASHLNVTIIDVPFTGKYGLGYATYNGTYHGLMRKVWAGVVDIGLNSQYLIHLWQIKMTYPHSMSGPGFVTRDKGNIPHWHNLLHIYDKWGFLGLLLTALASMVVFGCSNGHRYSSEYLNVLRLILGAPLVHMHKYSHARIFLSATLLSLLVLNTCFGARLMTSLTKPQSYHNIDTFQDLKESGYDVHGYLPYKSYVDEHEELLNRFYASPQFDLSCLEDIARGRPIACLSDFLYIETKSKDYEGLHVANAKWFRNQVFAVTRDWPLFENVNILIQRMNEAGLPSMWRQQTLLWIDRRHWAKKRANEPPRSKVFTMKDLDFIFYVLSFGLAVATVAFVLELLFYYCLGVGKVKSQRQIVKV